MTPNDFRAFAHLLPEAYLLATGEGEIVAVNPAAERLFARARPELEGAHLTGLVSNGPDEVRDLLLSASRTRGPVVGALTIRTGADEVHCACLGGVLERGSDAADTRILLRLEERAAATNRFRLLGDKIERLSEEIRRRRRAERESSQLLDELERSRELLEEAQRGARLGSWEWDVRTGDLTWSDELYRIYGLEPGRDRIDFDRFLSLVHPDDRERMQQAIDQALHDHRAFAFDHRILRPDGVQRTVQGRGRPVVGPDGEVLRLVGSGQDVTERKQEEDRFRFLAEAGHVLASSLDYEETLRRVAELAVPHIADWATVDVVEDGRIRRLAVHHSDPSRVELAEELADRWPPDADAPLGIAHVVRTGEPMLLPEISDALIDETVQSEQHADALRGLGLRSALMVPMTARHRVLGVIALVAAESGRVYGEGDLRLAQELAKRAALAIDNARLYREARDAARARDELMAMVSHDLRSPLNAVLAGAGLLLDAPLSDEKREEQVRAIRRAAQRMERLTGDLLDITRIEAGQLPIEPGPEKPRVLIEEALAGCGFAAGRTGVFLTSEVDDDLPEVHADRERTLQVLDNLLTNAIRHTPDGGRVTAAAERSADGVRFRVTDTGEGVPPEVRPYIFDRFRQGGGKSDGAAGLGLPIARGIVEAHGGRIWLESEVGQGSTFFFVLPLAREKDAGAVA